MVPATDTWIARLEDRRLQDGLNSCFCVVKAGCRANICARKAGVGKYFAATKTAQCSVRAHMGLAVRTPPMESVRGAH